MNLWLDNSKDISIDFYFPKYKSMDISEEYILTRGWPSMRCSGKVQVSIDI